MTSPFSKPVLVPTKGQAVVLERVPLTGANSDEKYSEDWLQDLLYRFPQALPIAELDDGFADAIPICKEMPTPVGNVDVVYITPNGRPIIVEAKLWRNPDAVGKSWARFWIMRRNLAGGLMKILMLQSALHAGPRMAAPIRKGFSRLHGTPPQRLTRLDSMIPLIKVFAEATFYC